MARLGPAPSGAAAALGKIPFPSAKRTALQKLKSATDYSPKGSLDAPIVELIGFINALPDYVTLSSCSGRVSVFGASAASEESGLPGASADDVEDGTGAVDDARGSESAKGRGKWLVVEHSEVEAARVAAALAAEAFVALSSEPDSASSTPTSTPLSEVTLLVEPFLLHVQCRDLDAARRLMLVAMSSGFRESGIGVGGKGKIVVGVRSTAGRLEVPLVHAGRPLVDGLGGAGAGAAAAAAAGGSSYLERLVAIANEVFRSNEVRRGRFERLLRAEMGRDAAAALADESAASPDAAAAAAGGVVCSACEEYFSSRNQLFKHLVPSPTEEGKRVCGGVGRGGVRTMMMMAPTTRVPAPAPAPASALAAVASSLASAAQAGAEAAPGASSSSSSSSFSHSACSGCGATFPARNALFRHVKTCGAAAVKKAAAAAAEAAAGAAAGSPQVVGPGGAGDAVVDAAALAVAAAAMAASHSLLSRRLAEPPSAHGVLRDPAFLPVEPHAERAAPSVLALLHRWSHAATVLEVGGSAGQTPLALAVVGGFVGTDGEMHRRKGDLIVRDQQGTWSVPRLASTLYPGPRVRHSASTVGVSLADDGPVQARAGALIVGGHDGPTRPQSDMWLLRLTAGDEGNKGAVDGAGIGFEALWSRVEPSGPLPADLATDILGRWGHAAATVGDGHVALFGGRDAHKSFNDVHVVEPVRVDASTARASAALIPVLVDGPSPAPRFAHAAAALPLAAGGRSADLVGRVVVHGGFVAPFLHGEHGATQYCGWGGSPARYDGQGAQLLSDVHVLSIHRGARWTGVWTQVRPLGLLPALQPRFSHTLTAVAPDAILILGGECKDPCSNRGVLLRFASWTEGDKGAESAAATPAYSCTASAVEDGISYGGVHDTSPTFEHPSASKDKARREREREDLEGEAKRAADEWRQRHPCSVARAARLPLLLRHTATLMPRSGAAAGGEDEGDLVVVGGGAVCFGFGSHFSRPLVSRRMPGPTAAPPLRAAADEEEGFGASDERLRVPGPALVVAARDAKWATDALQAVAAYDGTRKAAKTTILAPGAAAAPPSIAVPVTQDGYKLLVGQLEAEALAGSSSSRAGGSSSPSAAVLERLRAGTARLSPDTPLPPSASASALSPASNSSAGGRAGIARLRAALAAFLGQRGVSASEAEGLLVPGVDGGLPRKVEWVGDVLVLPADALTDPRFHSVLAPPSDVSRTVAVAAATASDPHPHLHLHTSPVWDVVASVFKCERVARGATIDPLSPTRASRVQLLRWREAGAGAGAPFSLPPPRAGADGAAAAPTYPPLPASLSLDFASGGWVRVRENGITYAFDIRRTMFSSGNVSEKARFAAFDARGETVVDLFAGIGYWTLPLLLHAGARVVHAADWNPDAVACLRINLRLNGVEEVGEGEGEGEGAGNPPSSSSSRPRCRVWPGDNSSLADPRKGLVGTADRVLLGLIPSSEAAWPVAVRLLKPAAGGRLHVHANVGEEGLGAWTAALPTKLLGLGREAGAAWAADGKCRVEHVERVKSYAPRVWHVVADVRCG
jgi:tRNA(Phe) wybutosine-synthesizing methylase Tyw3